MAMENHFKDNYWDYPEFAQQKPRWLRRQAPAIREELGRRIVLKFLPKLEYRLDEKTPKANRILGLLDELGPVPEEKQESTP